MRVLVTGAGGFVGRHAVQDLIRAHHEVIAVSGPGHQGSIAGKPPAFTLDLKDVSALEACISETRPEACLHLAGIAFVPDAWNNPRNAFLVNTIGTINLLEALRNHMPACRMLVVTSAQIYGHRSRTHLISEADPPDIESVYAASKWAADMTTLLYAQRYGMQTMTARPCNHIGPGQSESFAVSSFARQLIEISNGRRESVIQVGNLDSEREFTDVRDVASAYRLLLEKGEPGNAYNITSGKFHQIRDVLNALCAIIGVKPQVIIDPSLFRPTDTQPRLDTGKLVRQTGWKPEITLEQTLQDIVQDFRARSRA